VLVSEINANVPDGTVTPASEVADHAIHIATSGKRNKINFTAAQGSTITTAPEDEPRRRWKIVVTIIGLVAGILGAFFALMQAQGWHFGLSPESNLAADARGFPDSLTHQ
jgi:hypothetical protein